MAFNAYILQVVDKNYVKKEDDNDNNGNVMMISQ